MKLYQYRLRFEICEVGFTQIAGVCIEDGEVAGSRSMIFGCLPPTLQMYGDISDIGYKLA